MSDFVLSLTNIKLDPATEERISAALQVTLQAELQKPEVVKQIGKGALALRYPDGLKGGLWTILNSQLTKELELKKALPTPNVLLTRG